MESRLKERLTGAAILVALIVLLVPEIFRGQHDGDKQSATAGSGSDGAPLRSYTIDLSNNPKDTAPMRSTAEGSNPPPDGATVSPASTPAPAPPAAPAATVSSPTPTPTPTPTPASQSATVHTARPTASSTPPPAAAPTPKSVAKPAPKPASKPAAAGGWSVQLGLFAKRENAERVVAESRDKGFQCAISTDGKGQFRVRTAGVADRASAQSLAQRLKAAGLPAAVVAPGSLSK
jgi:DedD protein